MVLHHSHSLSLSLINIMHVCDQLADVTNNGEYDYICSISRMHEIVAVVHYNYGATSIRRLHFHYGRWGYNCGNPCTIYHDALFIATFFVPIKIIITKTLCIKSCSPPQYSFSQILCVYAICTESHVIKCLIWFSISSMGHRYVGWGCFCHTVCTSINERGSWPF